MDHGRVLSMQNNKAYKKVALSNYSNFGNKVVKKFFYLDCLMIQAQSEN